MRLALIVGFAIVWTATAQAEQPVAESLPESLAKKLMGGATVTIYPEKSKPIQLEKEKGCGIQKECFLVQYGDGVLKRECYLIKDCHM